MQNVLNSMRNNDIRAMGNSNIPSCDKQAAYGGYPRSGDSGNHDRNATLDLALHIIGGMNSNNDYVIEEIFIILNLEILGCNICSMKISHRKV